MLQQQSVAYINSVRQGKSLGLVPKSRVYNDEQMHGTVVFSDHDSHRELTVSGIGEMCLPPDRVKLNLIVVSVKSNIQEAKESVKRRMDYIDQTLRNYGVKEEDKTLVKSTSRQDSMFEVRNELSVTFIEIERYLKVQNHLAEKLSGPVVQILEPKFFYSSLRFENLKRQASLKAIRNAKETAQEIAKEVGLRISKALQIAEQRFVEKEKPNQSSENGKTFQSLIDAATIQVHVTISATFQLKVKTRQADETKRFSSKNNV